MRGPYEGKYRKLTEHLERAPEATETMTFGQIEEVLGFGLPESARSYQAWWANQPRGQSLAWISAGFRTSNLSIDEQRLTFLREDQPDTETGESSILNNDPISIAEAKERLAKAFGVSPSQVEITIRA